MKSLIILLLLIMVYACSTEADLFEYTTFISNESGSTLEIRGFDGKDELVFQDLLDNLEISKECESLSETFPGIGCRIDSIVFIFGNDKGYISHYRIGSDTSFFFLEEKTPFGASDFFNDLGNNRYEFIITEEDFNNAHDLPE